MRTGLRTDHSLTSTLHNHFANICWPFRRLWTVKLRQRGKRGLLCMWAGSDWLWILGSDQWLAVTQERLQTEWHVCVIRCRFFWAAPQGWGGVNLGPSGYEPQIILLRSWTHTQIHVIRPPSPTNIIQNVVSDWGRSERQNYQEVSKFSNGITPDYMFEQSL